MGAIVARSSVFAYPFIGSWKNETQYLNGMDAFVNRVCVYFNIRAYIVFAWIVAKFCGTEYSSRKKHSPKVDYHNLWVKYESDTSLGLQHRHVPRTLHSLDRTKCRIIV